jgi:hypothetical protein
MERTPKAFGAVRSTLLHDFHAFTPSDARSRPPSLILFSLDPKAHDERTSKRRCAS